MLGLVYIQIDTEEIAYPIDSEYLPLVRVFEAPYTVGDCPIDEIQFTNCDDGDPDNPRWWSLEEDEDAYGYRGDITKDKVFVRCLEDNPYQSTELYEIRIYPSDIIPR